MEQPPDTPHERTPDTQREGTTDARRQRLKALHDLATQAGDFPTADSQPAWQQSAPLTHQRPPVSLWSGIGGLQRRTSWIAVLAGLLVIAVIVAGVRVYRVMQAPHAITAAPIEIVPGANGLDCPHDAAWSPHSTLVALLGYQGGCPAPVDFTDTPIFAHPLPGLLSVYTVVSGRLVAKLQPDHLILPHIPLPDGLRALATTLQRDPTSFLQVDYTHVLWAADDDHLAITFTVFVPSGPPTGDYTTTPPTYIWPGSTAVGALMTDLSGKQAHVLEQPQVGANPMYVEWNVTTGTALAPTPSMSVNSAFAAQTPALAYRWSADGGLNPEDSLTFAALLAAPPLAPIGDPEGGAIFTIWQPGVAATTIPGSPSRPALSDAATWTVNIAALSPNGRFLVENVGLRGLLASNASPPPSKQARAASGWGSAPPDSHPRRWTASGAQPRA